MSDTIQNALPESEPHCERCGLPAIGHDENGCKWTEADVIRQHLRESRKEITRLRADVRRWTQYATDNASVAVRATTDAERLRVSLVEATRDTARIDTLADFVDYGDEGVTIRPFRDDRDETCVMMGDVVGEACDCVHAALVSTLDAALAAHLKRLSARNSQWA